MELMQNNLKQKDVGDVSIITETENEFVKNTCKSITKSLKPMEWNDDEIKLLKKLKEDDLNNIQISKIIGRSTTSISNKLIKLKLNRKEPSKNWSENEERELIELIENGLPIWKISEKVNKSIKSIQSKIKKLNISCHKNTKMNETKQFKLRVGNPILANLIIKRFNAAKFRANNMNVEFTITKDFLVDLYQKQNGKCFYSNRELRLILSERNRNNNDYHSLSIDRINSEKGYTEDNAVLCCSIVNIMKNGLSEVDFLNLCSDIINNNKKLKTYL
jgi:hypothetical protein